MYNKWLRFYLKIKIEQYMTKFMIKTKSNNTCIQSMKKMFLSFKSKIIIKKNEYRKKEARLECFTI